MKKIVSTIFGTILLTGFTVSVFAGDVIINGHVNGDITVSVDNSSIVGSIYPEGAVLTSGHMYPIFLWKNEYDSDHDGTLEYCLIKVHVIGQLENGFLFEGTIEDIATGETGYFKGSDGQPLRFRWTISQGWVTYGGTDHWARVKRTCVYSPRGEYTQDYETVDGERIKSITKFSIRDKYLIIYE